MNNNTTLVLSHIDYPWCVGTGNHHYPAYNVAVGDQFLLVHNPNHALHDNAIELRNYATGQMAGHLRYQVANYLVEFLNQGWVLTATATSATYQYLGIIVHFDLVITAEGNWAAHNGLQAFQAATPLLAYVGDFVYDFNY